MKCDVAPAPTAGDVPAVGVDVRSNVLSGDVWTTGVTVGAVPPVNDKFDTVNRNAWYSFDGVQFVTPVAPPPRTDARVMSSPTKDSPDAVKRGDLGMDHPPRRRRGSRRGWSAASSGGCGSSCVK